MYGCPMSQPPRPSVNLPLSSLMAPVRLSIPYTSTIIVPQTTIRTLNSQSIIPPPPYHLICLNSTPYDTDVDVVGLTDVARDVHISDYDDNNQYDQPLDLSVKKKEVPCSPSSSFVFKAQTRPTVIRNSYVGVQRNADMRRSASSVTSRSTPEPDVSEHFRRSLSGKWPRRQTNYVHYALPFPNDVDKKLSGFLSHRKNDHTLNLRRTTSCGTTLSKQIVVNNSGIEIEDHFRKALGAEAYELLRKNRRAS